MHVEAVSQIGSKMLEWQPETILSEYLQVDLGLTAISHTKTNSHTITRVKHGWEVGTQNLQL